MDWPAITAVVREVGFPAAVAIFVLVRLNGTLGQLRTALVALTVELVRHTKLEATQAETIHEALLRIERHQEKRGPDP